MTSEARVPGAAQGRWTASTTCPAAYRSAGRASATSTPGVAHRSPMRAGESTSTTGAWLAVAAEQVTGASYPRSATPSRRTALTPRPRPAPTRSRTRARASSAATTPSLARRGSLRERARTSGRERVAWTDGRAPLRSTRLRVRQPPRAREPEGLLRRQGRGGGARRLQAAAARARPQGANPGERGGVPRPVPARSQRGRLPRAGLVRRRSPRGRPRDRRAAPGGRRPGRAPAHEVVGRRWTTLIPVPTVTSTHRRSPQVLAAGAIRPSIGTTPLFGSDLSCARPRGEERRSEAMHPA